MSLSSLVLTVFTVATPIGNELSDCFEVLAFFVAGDKVSHWSICLVFIGAFSFFAGVSLDFKLCSFLLFGTAEVLFTHRLKGVTVVLGLAIGVIGIPLSF